MRINQAFALVAALVGASTAWTAESVPAERPLLQPPTSTTPSPLTDRFAVRAVFFRPSVSTTARYDSDTGAAGSTFDGEDTMGLQRTLNQGWIDLMFRMAERHRVTAQFYQLKRTGEAALGQALDFGNSTFQPGDGVIHSRMELRQFNLGYSYSAVRREQFELGVGFGIHLVQLEGSMEAPAVFKREHLDSAGPFPTLSGDVTWRFTRRFSTSARIDFFSYGTSKVDSSAMAWNADVQFRAHRSLAVGLGYASSYYRLDSTDPDFFTGKVKLRYRGPQLFLRAGF
jgi:hypothetical protein